MRKEVSSHSAERLAAYHVEPHELDVSFTLDVYPEELEVSHAPRGAVRARVKKPRAGAG
jgi:hypothetical protein